VALGDDYPTHFAELDQLYEAAGAPVEKRLALLEQHQAAVVRKDEGLASLIGLKTFAGKPDEAIALLQGRTFSIWEGGTRFNTGEAWTDAHVVRGLQRLAAKRYGDALADFQVALKFPDNLRAPAATGPNPRQAEITYWIACVRDAMGNHDQARESWNQLVIAGDTPAADGGRGGGGGRGFGNPVATRGVQRYYQALALRQLGQNDRAEPILRDLVASGASALQQSGDAADTGPAFNRQTPAARAAAAHYVTGLGYAGLGEKDKARAEFTAALAAVPAHLGAKLALGQL
jgi:tetratricopeptide (TPR) repeat protein